MARSNKFVAELRTVPLRIVCEGQSEYPTLSDKEEKFLMKLVEEFGSSDEKIGHEVNIRRSKAYKIQQLVHKYQVTSVYDFKKDELIIFYKDNKPPKFEELVAVMGDHRTWLIKKAMVEEAVITIRVPLTGLTDLDELDKETKRFAASVSGYREGDVIPVEQEVDKETLRLLCNKHHVGFPAGLFRRTKSLRRIVEPKYKPGN